jgi:hypothetical protein
MSGKITITGHPIHPMFIGHAWQLGAEYGNRSR